MVWYFVKLVLFLPLLGAAIWGSLKLTRHMQGKLGLPEGGKAARLIETSFLAPGVRLAVIEFRGKEILVGSTKQGLVRLAEADCEIREDEAA